MYDVGAINPALIVDYIQDFTIWLTSKNNRLQWGAMTALVCLKTVNPKAIYSLLPKIMDAAEKGTVITRDHAVKVLISLCGFKQYAANVFPLLMEQLQTCPKNQLPGYAKNMIPVITEKNKPWLIKNLKSRVEEFEKQSEIKRIEKIFKKIRRELTPN